MGSGAVPSEMIPPVERTLYKRLCNGLLWKEKKVIMPLNGNLVSAVLIAAGWVGLLRTALAAAEHGIALAFKVLLD